MTTTPLVTPNSVLMNPAEVNPHAQVAQILTVGKAKEAFVKEERKAKSDSVTISEEALRKAKDAESMQDEQDFRRRHEPEEGVRERG